MRTPDLVADAAMAAQDLGNRFTAALAAKDAAALLALFDDPVDFRALTPGRFWEAGTAAAVVGDVMLGAWFEPGDVIERVEAVESALVADRIRLGYRLAVTSSGSPVIVEQQAYLSLRQGRICWLRVMCSGFRAAAA